MPDTGAASQEGRPLCPRHGEPKVWRRDASKAAGGQWRCQKCQAAYVASYEASPRGKAARARYEASPRRRESWVAYRASPRGKAAEARYRASPLGRETTARSRYAEYRTRLLARIERKRALIEELERQLAEENRHRDGALRPVQDGACPD